MKRCAASDVFFFCGVAKGKTHLHSSGNTLNWLSALTDALSTLITNVHQQL